MLPRKIHLVLWYFGTFGTSGDPLITKKKVNAPLNGLSICVPGTFLQSIFLRTLFNHYFLSSNNVDTLLWSGKTLAGERIDGIIIVVIVITHFCNTDSGW